MAILPVGIGPQEGGYQIERSLRFNSDDSAYLSRTPASAGNRKTWTISVWIKRTNPGTENWVYDGGSTSNSSGFQFTDTNLLRVLSTSSSGAVDDLDIRTTQVFRDPSAWYHIVLSVDTTQATSTNRVKLYVNGSQVTAFGTANYPTQNYDFGVNNNHSQKIGKWNISTGRDFSGYMADFYLVDGQALDPTSFGEYNTDTGVWQPKAYTGSYGTNGFYLDFADNSSTTALGYDAAGSNDWTPNNFSVTAGAGNDSLVDTPTNYGTDTGVGAEVRGNYCTWNPNDRSNNGGQLTIANGNLEDSAASSVGGATVSGTTSISSGKWYFEWTQTATSSLSRYPAIGWIANGAISGNYTLMSQNTGGVISYEASGAIYRNNSLITTVSSFTNNDVIGVAYDADTGKMWFAKNGTWQASGNPSAGTNEISTLTGLKTPAVSHFNGSAGTVNFGQRPFAYTAPSGFKALCTQNLPEPTVVDGSQYFDVALYTGNGVTTNDGNTITGLGFQPNFVWLKCRSGAETHSLQDSVRGVRATMYSQSTEGENANRGYLNSFTSDGFTTGNANGASINPCNANGSTYAAWCWKANGTGVSNTAGSITSTVSANTTAGFSIVTYTGTGANATVGHGLSSAPSFVVVKRRDTTTDWFCYQKDIGATKYIKLNAADTTGTLSIMWNDTAPTSTTFSLGSYSEVNASGGTFVAYCFAPVAGYSAFGKYTGNGSTDGPFVYTGFRPRWVMIKRVDAGDTTNWFVFDTERADYNLVLLELYANLSNAEGSDGKLDILSNGFKIRTSGSGANSSSINYIYAAFAENPFKYSLAR